MFAIVVFGKRRRGQEGLDSFAEAENREGWNFIIKKKKKKKFGEKGE